MADDNKVTLEGVLSAEPMWGFNYGETKRAVCKPIVSFKFKSEKQPQGTRPFKHAISFNVKDDGHFEAVFRVDRNFLHLSDDGEAEEDAIDDLLVELQNHCGVRGISPEEMAKKAAEGILLLDHFRDFKREGK